MDCGKKTTVASSKCIVEGCTREFYHKSRMIQHLREDHDQQANEKVLKFNNKDEFLLWKAKEERENFVYFSKQTGECVKGDEKLAYYVCQHDGRSYTHHKSSEPARKTNRKYKRGSVKTNIVCLARLMVKYFKDQSVEVRYISTHSHELSFKNTEFQPIPPDTKKFIMEQLSMGVTPKEVQRKLQEKMAERDQRDSLPHMKIHHLNLQTIYEMRKRMKRKNTSCLLPDDITFIAEIVKKLQGESYDPVLIYKPQCEKTLVGECSKDDIDDFDDFFLIGIQTKEQKEMLLKGAEQIVCIDCTRDTNRYDFYLYTFLIRDELGRGFPTVHFISNGKSEAALTVMFKSLQRRCPNLKCTAVMTDDDPAIFNAMVSAFGPENAGSQLLSQWHIRHNWQNMINNSEVSDKALRAEIYSRLDEIMRQTTEEAFLELAKSFSCNYDLKAPSIVEHFNTKYMSCVWLWATCYRFPYGETDTDSVIESYHSRLKTFLSRKPNKRIDDLLDCLLKIEANTYMERKKRLVSPDQKAITDLIIQNRHRSSLKIPNEDVTKGVGLDNWHIKSHKAKETSYTVTKLFDQCTADFCYEQCLEKECIILCQHLYLCTCPDRATLCKHVHKIHTLRNSTRQIPTPNEQLEQIINTAMQDASISGTLGDTISSSSSPPHYVTSSPIPTEADFQIQQIVNEYSKLRKLMEEPAVKKYMLGSLLGTLQLAVKQCEATVGKAAEPPAQLQLCPDALPVNIYPHHQYIYQPAVNTISYPGGSPSTFTCRPAPLSSKPMYPAPPTIRSKCSQAQTSYVQL